MQKQQGFTLIELVVVIIILGILAVVAAPKFINLQSDARGSTLKGMKAAIEGANSMVYSKAVLQGAQNGTGTVDINGTETTDDDISTVNGYLAATQTSLQAGLDVTFDSGNNPSATGSNDWVINAPEGGTTAQIWQRGAPADAGADDTATSCSLTYTQSTGAGVKPTITVDTSGC
ncbi:type II secretion system protein [Shewanella sp.]|uniref:type II secretion system protein n=1 Tax=Shewanella sp. TaxID=50422 RepID=UPI003A979388